MSKRKVFNLSKGGLAFILPISMLAIGCSDDDLIDDEDSNYTKVSQTDLPPQIPSDEEMDKKSRVVPVSGRVIDGYIENAHVFADLNKNGKFDLGEPETFSDEKGSYHLKVEGKEQHYIIIAENGTDTLTNKPFQGKLSSVVEAGKGDNVVVTPVTTLVAEDFLKSGGKDLEGAKKHVAEILKISPEKLDDDFIANKDEKLFKVNQDVLVEIHKLTLFAKESNKTKTPTKDAVHAILESGKLDSKKSVEKLSEKLHVKIEIPTDSGMENATAMAESATNMGGKGEKPEIDEKIDENLSFEEKIKKIQEEKHQEIKELEEKKDHIKIEPVPFEENSFSSGEFSKSEPKEKRNILEEKVEAQKIEIESKISKVKEEKKPEGEISPKWNKIIDFEKKDLKSESLKNLEKVEEESGKYIEEAINLDYLDNISDFADSYKKNFGDSLIALNERVKTILSTAPAFNVLQNKDFEVTTDLGDKVLYKPNGESLEVIVSNENGSKLIGKLEFENGIPSIKLQGNLEDETYSLQDVAISKDGLVGKGDIDGKNGATIKANRIDIAQGKIAIDGDVQSDNFNFKGKISLGNGIAISGKLEDGKGYSFDGVYTISDGEKMTDEERAEHKAEMEERKANGEYMTDEERAKRQSEMEKGERLGKGRVSLSVSGAISYDDRKVKLSLKYDRNILVVSDFSMSFGEKAYLSFAEMKADGGMNLKHTTIPKREMKANELQEKTNEPQAYPPSPPNTTLQPASEDVEVTEVTEVTEVNTTTLVSGYVESAETNQVVTTTQTVQTVTTTTLVEEYVEVIEEIKTIEAIEYTEIIESAPTNTNTEQPEPVTTISKMELKVNTEFGPYTFQGDWEFDGDMAMRKGISTLGDTKLVGTIIANEDESLTFLDVEVSTPEFEKLKLEMAEIDDKSSIALTTADGETLLIEDDGNSITAIDDNGVFVK